MRTPALQFSLLAAALSPTLVQAAPTPYSPGTPFSPRLAPDSPRPSGNYGRFVPAIAPRTRALGLGFIAARGVDSIQSGNGALAGSLDKKSFTGIGSFGKDGDTLLGVIDDYPYKDDHDDDHEQDDHYDGSHDVEHRDPPREPYHSLPSTSYKPDGGNINASQPSSKQDCDDEPQPYDPGNVNAAQPGAGGSGDGYGDDKTPADDPYDPNAGNVDAAQPAEDADCDDNDQPYSPDAGNMNAAQPAADDPPATIDPVYPDPGEGGEDCDDAPYDPNAGDMDAAQPAYDEPEPAASDSPYSDPSGAQPGDCDCEDDGENGGGDYPQKPRKGGLAAARPYDGDGHTKYPSSSDGNGNNSEQPTYNDPPANSHDPSYSPPSDGNNYNAAQPAYDGGDPKGSDGGSSYNQGNNYGAKPTYGDAGDSHPGDGGDGDSGSNPSEYQNQGDGHWIAPEYDGGDDDGAFDPIGGNINLGMGDIFGNGQDKHGNDGGAQPGYDNHPDGGYGDHDRHDHNHDHDHDYKAGSHGGAHSGPGGDARGGDVVDPNGLINLWSGNAGDAGYAPSGAAANADRDSHGSASSGPGGDAQGGDVFGGGGPKLLNLGSENAGDGGDARSGDALNLSSKLDRLGRFSRSLEYGVFGRRMFQSAASPESAHVMEETPANIHPIYAGSVKQPKRALDAADFALDDDGTSPVDVKPFEGNTKNLREFIPRGGSRRV